MNTKFSKYFLNPFTLFLVLWGILNLVQARLTPINNDEAYYWMYSKYLAWGFFDHPPMIALMIKIGYLLFQNELGVRLLIVLSQLAALSIIWITTEKEQQQNKRNIYYFFLLIIVLPVLNIYGFFAIPDAPLILFTAVFLFAYKKFLNDESWQNTLFLGFSMAAVIYSKYHGGLLIIIVILSNLKLLKSGRFYMAAILAVLLFIPHLHWQYINGFPSLKYHLVDRVSGFNLSNVPNYLASQLVLHNPLILPVLIWIIIKVRPVNLFDRALYYIVTGFFGFFFIASFRYHIEPQWTALVSVPMVLILFNNIEYKSWIRGFIKWVTFLVFPVLLFARLVFMFDFLPVSFIKNEYHNNKKWVKDISLLAGPRPVVFTNSYQHASVYTFYTGKFAHSLDNLNYRKTQYDLWNFEEQLHGKEVLYVPHFLTDYYKENLTKYILPNGDSVFVRVYKDFQSLQRECVILSDDLYTFDRTGTNSIHLRIFNPYPFMINFRHNELPVVFQIAFIKNGYREAKKDLKLPDNITKMNVGDTISADCQFTIEDLPPGLYKIAICSETGILYDTYSSNFKSARIR